MSGPNDSDGVIAVPIPTVLLGEPDAELARLLEAGGCHVEPFIDFDTLWGHLDAGSVPVAVWVNDGGVDMQGLRDGLFKRLGSARPVVVQVGPGATVPPADAVVADPKDTRALKTVINLITRIAEQCVDRQTLTELDRRVRGAVDHDLRSPLAALSHLGDVLASEMLSANGRSAVQGLLQVIRTAERRLDSIVVGTAGWRPRVNREPREVRALVEEAATAVGLTPMAVVWLPEDLDPRARLDGAVFGRVIEHLLAHAWGYGGRVTCRVELEGGRLLVEIEAGASSGAQRPMNENTERYCREAVAAHGGTLEFRQPRAGAFMARTTWPEVVDVRRLGRMSTPEPPPERPIVVWFADDEPLVRRAVTRLLKRAKCDIRTFDTGDLLLEALDEAGTEPPEVIICDADMPGTQGLEVLRQVRERLPQAARVLYTAYQPTSVVVEAFNQGIVHRYLNKGRGAAEIEACVVALTASRRAQESPAERDQRRAALEELLNQQQVELFLQPIYDAKTRRMCAAEALLRSRHPAFRGPLDILEATRAYARELPLQRLLSTIGVDICRQLPEDVRLFMNVDPIVLGDPQQIDLAFAPLYPVAERIVLELTERAQLASDGIWQQAVSALREHGFRVALDDVGAGYNSLGAVAAVSPDVMKLDISLVANVHREARKSDLVRVLCDYASHQQITTIAEGIEEEGEALRCRDLGVRWLQGYHLARPMPAATVIERLHQEAGYYP